jgi:hypothetical protein
MYWSNIIAPFLAGRVLEYFTVDCREQFLKTYEKILKFIVKVISANSKKTTYYCD